MGEGSWDFYCIRMLLSAKHAKEMSASCERQKSCGLNVMNSCVLDISQVTLNPIRLASGSEVTQRRRRLAVRRALRLKGCVSRPIRHALTSIGHSSSQNYSATHFYSPVSIPLHMEWNNFFIPDPFLLTVCKPQCL